MTIDWLSGWYNWPFLFPLAFGIMFILLDLLIGGMSQIIGGVLDFEVDLDGDGEIDTAADVDAHPGFLAHAFMWLGMGRVPLSIIIECLTIIFGITGLLVNAIWSEVGILPGFSLPVALGVASVVSIVATHAGASTLARLLPSESTISRPAGGFVGEPAVVVNTITATAGQIRVEGQGNRPNTVLNAKLYVQPDGPSLIARGRGVIVMEYVEAGNCYLVSPLNMHNKETPA